MEPNPTATSDGATVATALARLHAATGRAGFGRATRTSESTLVGPLRCTSREGAMVIESDLPAALGGGASAPSPAMLVRAALGACLAMGYRLRAAELGVELTAVRVTVHAESELRGMLDPGADVPPGFTDLRYHVAIESSAPQPDVERVVELADRLSPVLDMLTRAHTIEHTVSIERVA